MKIYRLVVALLLCQFSWADCSNYYCGDVYVDRLYPNNHSLSYVYVETSGNASLLTQCTPVGGKYFLIKLQNEGAKAIYSTLLGAQLADKKVSIVAINGSPECEVAYVTLDRVQ